MPYYHKPDTDPSPVTAALLQAVPVGARRILDVGCGDGGRGVALKQRDPLREVFGLERNAALVRRAAGRLDRVFTLDAACDDLPLEPGSLDCVLYGGVLGRLADPGAVLRRHRRLLRPSGTAVCLVPNVQHHALLAALGTGDFPYGQGGAHADFPLRPFSRSTFVKLLLDCGFEPELLEAVTRPCPPDLWEALGPLIRHLRLEPGRARRHFDACHYVFRGILLADGEAGGPPHESDHRAGPPLTFVACVSDDAVLKANLLNSPCLGPGSPHQVLLMHNCPNAAAGLNAGLAQARHDWVICLHQDVYLPAGWPTRFWRQSRLAQERCGPVGVAGVFGARGSGDGRRLLGHVVHQDRPLNAGNLPAVVDTLDELLLAVPRGTPLTFDPALGFHFYAADLCLAARRKGLSAVALDAPCSHNTRSNWYPTGFAESGAAFATKWATALPVATPCIHIEASGALRIPDAETANRSEAGE